MKIVVLGRAAKQQLTGKKGINKKAYSRFLKDEQEKANRLLYKEEVLK